MPLHYKIATWKSTLRTTLDCFPNEKVLVFMMKCDFDIQQWHFVYMTALSIINWGSFRCTIPDRIAFRNCPEKRATCQEKLSLFLTGCTFQKPSFNCSPNYSEYRSGPVIEYRFTGPVRTGLISSHWWFPKGIPDR